jgi:ParB family chromosome partitioning protein
MDISSVEPDRLEKFISSKIHPKLDAEVVFLPLESLFPLHNQPRKHFNSSSLEELSNSIKNYGLIQPIVVSPDPHKPSSYTIIAGERRWRACKHLNLGEVPCLILKAGDGKDHHEVALIENIQREQLTPLEEAECYQFLIKKYGYSHESLALKIGKSRTVITNALRLLLLPEAVKEELSMGTLSQAHARLLCSLDQKEKIINVLNLIKAKDLSVRQLEQLIKTMKGQKKKKDKSPYLDKNSSLNFRYISDQLKAIFGTKVSISEAGKDSKGLITIEYFDHEDLQRIIELMVNR